MNKIILSIIVPVFNTEQYIDRCIKSILNQNFKDFEIIIIDDGSTDGSRKKIEQYKKNKKIKCIYNNENKGQGFARNLGIKLSTGTYLTFVDSDDWIEKSMYEEMLNLIIKSGSDIIECNLKNSSTNKSFIKSLVPCFKKDTFSIDKYIISLSKSKLGFMVTNKIYKEKVIKNNNIKFKDNKIIFSEDLYFNLEVMHYVNKITTINKPFYHYCVRNGSSSQSNNFINFNKIKIFLDNYKKDYEKFDTYKKDYSAFPVLMISFIKSAILNPMRICKNPINTGVAILINAKKDPIIFNLIKNCSNNNNLTIKDRIFCFLTINEKYYTIIIIYLTLTKIKKIINIVTIIGKKYA